VIVSHFQNNGFQSKKKDRDIVQNEQIRFSNCLVLWNVIVFDVQTVESDLRRVQINRLYDL